MLSVLVVQGNGDGRPGTGLFDLSRSLGHDVRDRDGVFVDDLRKVYNHRQDLTITGRRQIAEATGRQKLNALVAFLLTRNADLRTLGWVRLGDIEPRQ